MNSHLSLPLWYSDDRLESALQALDDTTRSLLDNGALNGSIGTGHAHLSAASLTRDNQRVPRA
jgi:hypothetical protein